MDSISNNQNDNSAAENAGIPPAKEDILQTGHVRVFNSGLFGAQYDTLLQNQLTEIAQGQDTRGMLTQMLEEKKEKKKFARKSLKSTISQGSDGHYEVEGEEMLVEQLLEATKDYRKKGGSMLTRKSKNLSLVVSAWKKSMISSSKVSDRNKETLAKYADKDLCSLHIQCAKAAPAAVAIEEDDGSS
ncbi:hypothetical protein VTL71DRAFT_14746 [Oculimacula yallundae]|uniref:Uncharacterized protein n=1 Tax=Oculimacula yallundae TaxID=86028 RepID=A0ABR4CLG3_9HELO